MKPGLCADTVAARRKPSNPVLGRRADGRLDAFDDLEVAIRECGIRQTEGEFEAWRDVLRVEMAVVDNKLLRVVDRSLITVSTISSEGGIFGKLLGDGVGKAASRADLAVKDVGRGIVILLNRHTGPDDCGDVQVVDPLLDIHFNDRVHNNNGVLRTGSTTRQRAVVRSLALLTAAMTLMRLSPPFHAVMLSRSPFDMLE